MVCVYCGGNTRVINSRPQKRSNAIWRRRSCNNCKNVFSTTESINLAQALRYELSDGKLLPFNQEILFISIYESFKHRKNPTSDASHITQTIITKIIELNSPVVTRSEVVSIASSTLKLFDNAAYIQYVAFHDKR